jgi:hypothetical protein
VYSFIAILNLCDLDVSNSLIMDESDQLDVVCKLFRALHFVLPPYWYENLL